MVVKEENPELVETRFYLAFVFSGSLRSFDMIKDYAAKFTDARLIYQRYSPTYLQIVKSPEDEAKKGERKHD